MKKRLFFSLFLCVFLIKTLVPEGSSILFLPQAGAESWFPTWQETPSPSPSPDETGRFSFRNGITWLMSPEEVKAAETGLQTEERSQANWSVVYSVGRVEVSRFFADLVYIFRDRQLYMILYAFAPGETATTFAYLAEAISSVHGSRTRGEALEVVSLMDQVYPGMYTTDALSDLWAWVKPDGTRIFLYKQSNASFSILYVSPDSLLSGNGAYATNGL